MPNSLKPLKVKDKRILALKHTGFPSKSNQFMDESINSIRISGFRHRIITKLSGEPITQQHFDVLCTDKSKLYDFTWDNNKYFINMDHNVTFSSILDILANIEDYMIEKSIDKRQYNEKNQWEKRWNCYAYTISKNNMNSGDVGGFIHITYTMRRISLNNDNTNPILTLRIISTRIARPKYIKKKFPLWWKNMIVDKGRELKYVFEKNESEKYLDLKEKDDLVSKRCYIQVTDLLAKKRYEEWLSVNDLIKDEYNALVEQKGITTIEEYQNYLFSTIDYCKIYAFDPEVDTYDDFSEECANRIKLFNLKNTVAFNRSINKLREAGIHLPDCRDSQDYWVGYEQLRDLIEMGGDQKEILRLFPIVFGEYVVMPGDVDVTDPETKRFTTIGGHFPYVYLENTLPCSEYGPNNLWTVEKGKQWLKDRQMALLEDKDR